MFRVGMIIFLCILSLTGCNRFDKSIMKNEEPIAAQYKHSADEIYLGDIRVVDLLTLKRDQISDKMGDHTIFYGLGDDEDREGYYYL